MIGLLLIAAELCAPAVGLVGEAELVDDVSRALSERGVTVSPVPGCPAPEVAISRSGERLVLALAEGAARREASDSSIAALIVESWARADLAAPLLLPPPAPRESIPLAAAPLSAEPGGPRGELRLVLPRSPLGLDLDARAELGAALDGAVWWGGAIEARLDLEAWSPTAALRIATNHAAFDPTLAPSSRVLGDLMIGGRLNLELGPVRVQPGLLLGLGLLTSRRDAPPSCTGATGCSPGLRVVDDGFVKSYATPKLEAGLLSTIPLADPISLQLFVAATIAPWAQEAGFVPDYASGLSPAEQAGLALQGDAIFVFRAGFGLGFEVLR